MAFTKRIARNPQPARGHVPPLPHPSWRTITTANADGSASARVASAADFWDRLGL